MKETELGIMEAVYTALIDSFKIKPDDRNGRLVVHEPHRFQCPPGREKPEACTHISIDCFTGRSLQAKRSLYKTIVNGLQASRPITSRLCSAKSPRKTGA